MHHAMLPLLLVFGPSGGRVVRRRSFAGPASEHGGVRVELLW